MSGDDRERPRRSWREIDQMRDRARSSGDRPRGRAAEERTQAASKQYLKQLDGMFSRGRGGPEGERLARAMRAAHGTPGLADACRAYRDALGAPSDASLASLFLDSGEAALVLEGIGALRAAQQDGRLGGSRGLRSQLRLLAQDSDDAVAEAAEELLADL